VVAGWYGRVASLPEGAQFDDKLVLYPEGAGEVGVAGATAQVEAQIVALRDLEGAGSDAHFWGRLTCQVPDVNGCQLLVEKLRVDGPGDLFEPDPVVAWEGTIVGLSYDEPGAPQPDDAFVPAGDHPVRYGIDSAVSAETGERDLSAVLVSLRDSGTVRIWGTMTCGVPDAGGCHIKVYRIDAGGQIHEITPAA
jgi:hypothetical protein